MVALEGLRTPPPPLEKRHPATVAKCTSIAAALNPESQPPLLSLQGSALTSKPRIFGTLKQAESPRLHTSR